MFSSLRVRLVLSSVGLSLAILTLLFAVSYVSLDRFLEDSNVATAHHNARIAMDVLDYEVTTLRQLMSWLAVSGPLQNFLTLKEENEEAERRRILAAYDVLHSALYGNILSSDIRKFIIVDSRGRSIQMGNVMGHWSDAARARLTVEQGTEGLITDPYHFSRPDTVIALNKIVTDDFSGRETAWIQVVLSTEFLTRALSSYTFDPESRVFFVIGPSVLTLGPDRVLRPSDLSATLFPQQDENDQPRRVKLDLDGERRLYVTYQARGTGWSMVQSVPRTQFNQKNSVFLVLAGFVVAALVLLLLLILVLVERMVNRPVSRLQRRLATIAGGDFGFDPTIEFRHELGDIGRGINAMARNLEQHIVRRIQDERAQKDLEYQVLQSQVNPHFLYNTLNSIKWMAEIQKSPGIAEMAGSLAVLLKHVAKGTDELIPVKQELSLVKEYFTIQDYRTGGLAQLKVVIEDEALEVCRVPKFTLQPLVENALQHGIEPTGRPGTIVVFVHRQDGALQIDVTDDGAGIAPERMANLWGQEARSPGQAFTPVGLNNVRERIRRRFGQDYGLTVRSELGVFTTVSVRVPLEAEREEDVHAHGTHR